MGKRKVAKQVEAVPFDDFVEALPEVVGARIAGPYVVVTPGETGAVFVIDETTTLGMNGRPKRTLRKLNNVPSQFEREVFGGE